MMVEDQLNIQIEFIMHDLTKSYSAPPNLMCMDEVSLGQKCSLQQGLRQAAPSTAVLYGHNVLEVLAACGAELVH